MYQIEEPTYFYYLAIIPVIIVLFLLAFWWKKRTQKRFTDSLLLEKLAPNTSTFKSVLKMIFLIIGIGFLVIFFGKTLKWETKLKNGKKEKGVGMLFFAFGCFPKSMFDRKNNCRPNRVKKKSQRQN